MADLRTDYKDDILDTSVNTQRKYRMITNDDGTVSFVDETVYTQNGDTFGASEVNQIHAAVNLVNESLNVRYNEDTDMIQINFGGVWTDWLGGGMQILDLLATTSTEWALDGFTFTKNDSSIFFTRSDSTKSFSQAILIKERTITANDKLAIMGVVNGYSGYGMHVEFIENGTHSNIFTEAFVSTSTNQAFNKVIDLSTWVGKTVNVGVKISNPGGNLAGTARFDTFKIGNF